MSEPAENTAKKFTEGYTFKALLLAGFTLLMFIPLLMIGGLIGERRGIAGTAEAGIMEAWGGELIAAGPMVVIPGIRTETRMTTVQGGGQREEVVRHPFSLTVMPKDLTITAHFETEIRRRGIFSVPLFSGVLSLSGNFDPELALASLVPGEEVFFDQAELIINLSSQQGIRRMDRASWDAGSGTRELFFAPVARTETARSPMDWDPQTRLPGGGIFAALPDFSAAVSSFDIAIALQGGRLVRVLPVGRQTRTAISSDWPSPSFQGAFLPVKSEIGEAGFEAEWDISYLSRGIPLFRKEYPGDARRDYGEFLFGADFFCAVDAYSLNHRATRYAMLFLVIPFLALFLLELHTKKRIHPVQYLFSGIANIVFYLLLLSLSEQMRFHFAYLIAALAVAVLLTLYARSLLPSWGKTLYMAMAISLSYILLYAVLNAESFALLIGSVYAFALVALVMFLTRKVDWYGPNYRR
ncbi:MAG: cell envelope integrity protein CreD [Treponema sp.]|nr:cell envelope integrity protein CreD [Treponema sp.]